MLKLVIIFLDQLKPMLFIAFEFFIDGQNSLNLLLFGGNDWTKNGKIVVIVSLEVRLTLTVSFTLFSKLVIIELS